MSRATRFTFPDEPRDYIRSRLEDLQEQDSSSRGPGDVFVDGDRVVKVLEGSAEEKYRDDRGVQLLDQEYDSPRFRARTYSESSQSVRDAGFQVPEVVWTEDRVVETEAVDGRTMVESVIKGKYRELEELGERMHQLREEGVALMDAHPGNFVVEHRTGDSEIYLVDPEFVVPEATEEMLDYDLETMLGYLSGPGGEKGARNVYWFARGYGIDHETVSESIESAAEAFDPETEKERRMRRNMERIASRFEAGYDPFDRRDSMKAKRSTFPL